MTEVVICCDQCDYTGLPAQTVVERWPDGSPRVWTWSCPGCGAARGFGIDGGRFELGVVRASAPDFESDFQVFKQPPPDA